MFNSLFEGKVRRLVVGRVAANAAVAAAAAATAAAAYRFGETYLAGTTYAWLGSVGRDEHRYSACSS